MPRSDTTDPKIINFLLESYDKEILYRVRWLKHHKDEVDKAAIFKREEKNYTEVDVKKHHIYAEIDTIKRDHVASARHRLVGPQQDYMRLQEVTAKLIKPKMKAVDKKEKENLLEGRVKYLKERNRKAPEDKFNFVDCESWNYGWKLGESEMDKQGPIFGRKSLLKNCLQSRVGLLSDPVHYKSEVEEHICD